MKPKDADDLRFAARLVIDGFLDQEAVGRLLETQTSLIEKGKPVTVAQICVAKKWLTRAEARFLLADTDLPSDLVEGYEILGHLGSGGMSKVFQARSLETGDIVALKILEPRLAHDETQRSRFLREGELLARFDHENVVRCDEVVEHDGLCALALELVPGRELLEVIDEKKSFSEDLALFCVLQIARGLEHMHAHGIVHRDIKPGNVLFTEDNRIVIIDLGLATELDGSTDEEQSEEETTVGTVEYISPEQARGESDLDVRSDIYALGVSLYHLVVGDIPFRGEDSHETMAKRFEESLSSPQLAHVSPHVHYFIQKMMATEKEIRYTSPAALIEDIEQQIEGNKSLFRSSEEKASPKSVARPQLKRGRGTSRKRRR